VARPEALVLWEAQFGDFVNGAQTVIDEYISSGKTKWGQDSGVVLLLPHGYEGQGADHSSARIERFLMLAADEAFVVAQPSTPASYFHLLRRHALGEVHRPLVVFTPKSMLRRKEAASQPDDFTSGSFQTVVGDATADPARVETLLLCSGRVTWDLMVERGKRENGDTVAVARVEQLYPWPVEELKAEIAKYPNLKTVRWVQDEPFNQGPWPSYALNVVPHLGVGVQPVTRQASSTTAVGTVKRHLAEQAVLMDQAFA
jgi:2-oxoglutarate dehydrogenase E1 component